MKKTLIAGAGVAALGFAALPFAGVFAAVSSVTDTVTLEVTKTCEMNADAATKTVELGTLTAGQEYSAKDGSVLTITCNSLSGWHLDAEVGALKNGTDNSKVINFNTDYATEKAAGRSVWTATFAETTKAGWNGTTNKTILEGAAVNGTTLTPSYKAYANGSQEAGVYTGTIVYTFSEGPAA